MRKEQIENHILDNVQEGDSLIGFFRANTPINIGMYFLIGPLAALSMKQYYVAASKNGIYFHKLGMWGKFKELDFFPFSEIATVSFGKGFIQRPLKFNFNNGRTLKLNAQLKGAKTLPKLTDDIQQHIASRIHTES